MKAVASDRSARQVDLENFDYAGLRVKPNSVWVVQLALMGYQDANNRFTDNDVPGSQPTFQIFVCTLKLLRAFSHSLIADDCFDAPDDEKATYRATEGSGQPGLPSSDFVLQWA